MKLFLIILPLFFSLLAYGEKPRDGYENNLQYILSKYLGEDLFYSEVQRDSAFYMRMRADLDWLIGLIKENPKPNKFNLDKMFLYIFEIQNDSAESSGHILNFTKNSDSDSAIVLRLTQEQMRTLNRETFLFILGHELNHGLIAASKRYYLQKQNTVFKFPRYNDEDIKYNSDLKPLLDYASYVGFSASTKQPSLEINNGLILEFLTSLFEKLLTEEERRANSQRPLPADVKAAFASIENSYDEFAGDFILNTSHNNDVYKINQYMRRRGKLNEKVKNFSFNSYINYYDFGEGARNYLAQLFLIKKQIQRTSIDDFLQKNIVTVAFDAATLYYEKYLANKDRYDEALPNIRYYSEENIADEDALLLLRSHGIEPSSYSRGFLKFTNHDSAYINKCIDEYINKGIEPPIGPLSFDHPNACWRMYNLKKLNDYYKITGK